MRKQMFFEKRKTLNCLRSIRETKNNKFYALKILQSKLEFWDCSSGKVTGAWKIYNGVCTKLLKSV